MMQAVERASVTLLTELLMWALRSTILAGIAGAGLTAFRARTTSLRLFVWSSVLYASIALPLLAWLLPPMQVPAPDFLGKRTVRIESNDHRNSPNVSPLKRSKATNRHSLEIVSSSPRPLVSQAPAHDTHPTRSALQSFSEFSLHWEEVAAGLYLLVAITFLMRFAAGVLFTRKVLGNAEPIAEASAAFARAFDVASSSAQFASSDCISVPITVGTLHPTILLPADWRTWDDAKLNAVLAHELSHVARRDALTQRIALLYRAVFWFNPLCWWLSRHLAVLAEQASDEAALSGGADRNHYARTLLSFFQSLQAATGRIRWQGVSMARHGQAEQRLERILAWKGTVTMNLKKSLALAILVAAIPFIYVAAAIRPANVARAAAPVMAAQSAAPASARAPVGGTPVGGVIVPAPAGGVAGAAPVGGVTAPAVITGVPAAGPITAVQPAAPVAAVALAWGVGQSYSSGTGKGFSYHYGFDDEDRFVIVSGKSDSLTMSGSSQDARHAERLKKQIPGDFIWFQRDERSYIIRDQATIDRARALWAPQEELGRKQEELGKQQEELGKQQEELGSKMEQVRVNVPDMTAELDRLKAKLQKLGPKATMDQIGDIQSEIGELQSKIGEIQSQAGEQQSKVGELQSALGEKQGKLGEQQGELGRQQAELAEKATREMKQLLDESLKNGSAKPEPESGGSGTL